MCSYCSSLYVLYSFCGFSLKISTFYVINFTLHVTYPNCRLICVILFFNHVNFRIIILHEFRVSFFYFFYLSRSHSTPCYSLLDYMYIEVNLFPSLWSFHKLLYYRLFKSPRDRPGPLEKKTTLLSVLTKRHLFLLSKYYSSVFRY